MLALYLTLQVTIPDISSQVFVLTTQDRYGNGGECIAAAIIMGDAIVKQFREAYPVYQIEASADCKIPPHTDT